MCEEMKMTDNLLMNAFGKECFHFEVVDDSEGNFALDDLLTAKSKERSLRVVELEVWFAHDDGTQTAGPCTLLLSPDHGAWLVESLDALELGGVVEGGLARHRALLDCLVARGWAAEDVPLGLVFVRTFDDLPGVELPAELSGRVLVRSDLPRLVERIVEIPTRTPPPTPRECFVLICDLLDLGPIVDLHTLDLGLPCDLPRWIMDPARERRQAA